jgi:hypothetical protein
VVQAPLTGTCGRYASDSEPNACGTAVAVLILSQHAERGKSVALQP